MDDRKKFMHDIRVENKPEYDDKREFERYERFVNSSAFDEFNKIEVPPYQGDIEI